MTLTKEMTTATSITQAPADLPVPRRLLEREMTSRERVLAAVRGEPVDRVPVLYWLNPHMTCRLLAEYQPSDNPIVNLAARALWRRFQRRGRFEAGEWTRLLPLLFEEFGNGTYAVELGADISIQSPELMSPKAFATSIHKEDGELRLQGPFGGTMGIGGIYAELLETPIKDARDLAGHELPPVKPQQFAGIRKVREAHPDLCIIAEAMSFQQALADYILGTERFMYALYDHPEEIKAFMARLADWVIEISLHLVDAGVDFVYLQDDYGATERPMISMRMWREFTYPHLTRMVDAVHDAGGLFMLHSCGYQMPFLDDYVAAGIDVLQSFQPKAGNDFEAAYAEYGDRIAFATGIDIQRGESMTPAELRKEILRNYRIGRTRGRHILSTTHMMQISMPMENVRTIFETVREIQAGEHDA